MNEEQLDLYLSRIVCSYFKGSNWISITGIQEYLCYKHQYYQSLYMSNMTKQVAPLFADRLLSVQVMEEGDTLDTWRVDRRRVLLEMVWHKTFREV